MELNRGNIKHDIRRARPNVRTRGYGCACIKIKT
jgi:hypothetical protein